MIPKLIVIPMRESFGHKSMYTKAVFIDIDDTLVEKVPNNVKLDQLRLIDRAIDGLQILHQACFKIFIVTNQAGVAHGHFPEEALLSLEECLRKLLQDAGVPLAGFYYCPHHPDGRLAKYAINCFCRKPSPGLLFRAARENLLNLADSWTMGDNLDDVEAGRRADCRTVMVDNGNEIVWRMTPLRRPHFTVANHFEAAEVIVKTENAPAQTEVQSLPVTVRSIPIITKRIDKEKIHRSSPVKVQRRV